MSLTDTPRGPFTFDHFGNVVGNFYIRRIEKKGDKLVDTTIKTYPKVSQFWTYDEKWFLAQPVYSRDYPPAEEISLRGARSSSAASTLDRRRAPAPPTGSRRAAATMNFWLVLAKTASPLAACCFCCPPGSR